MSRYLTYELHVGKAMYVLGKMARDDAPVLVTRWWQVSRVASNGYKPIEEYAVLHGRELTSHGGGSGCFIEPQSSYRFWLIDGGGTEANRIDETPIPPPKTKCPTRWRCGQWEKEHKRRGWIPA